MSYDINVLVGQEQPILSSDEFRNTIEQLPLIDALKPKSGYAWELSYQNPDTGVYFSFLYKTPSDKLKRNMLDTGLQIKIPCPSPTFVAKESFPVVVQLAAKLNLSLLLPSGDLLEKYNADQLQVMWSECNRFFVKRMARGESSLKPFYFPKKTMDAMWQYLAARPALLNRYNPLNIYVPRILLLRHKHNRFNIYRTAVWSDLCPSVIPDVDAFIIGQPEQILFGHFPRGDFKPVFVAKSVIEEVIQPYLKTIRVPFEHQIIENTKHLKLPVYKTLAGLLNFSMHDYESADLEEIIDIK